MLDFFLKRYPSLFEYSSSGHLRSSLHCPVGWIDLLHPIFIYIEDYNSKQSVEEDKIKIIQIKEKFAQLVIYTNLQTDELSVIKSDAISKSRKKCMFCDEEGKIRGKGWIYIACDLHEKN